MDLLPAAHPVSAQDTNNMLQTARDSDQNKLAKIQVRKCQLDLVRTEILFKQVWGHARGLSRPHVAPPL